MTPFLKHHYHTKTLLITFSIILLQFSPTIFAGRILQNLPCASPTPEDEPEDEPDFERWPGDLPMTLKYAFLQENPLGYLSQPEIDSAFARSFATWSSVIPVSFEKTGNLSEANITIGFFRGDHCDGAPFDGMGTKLAHAFYPPDGGMHFDADERWAVDSEKDLSKYAYDLQSSATHEIGHLLGLGHINHTAEAIMFPWIHIRTRKVYLSLDDVINIQELYGSSPDFDPRSLHLASSGFRLVLGWFIVLLAGMIIIVL